MRKKEDFLDCSIRTPVATSGVSWLKFEPGSQILFETKYEKKTKRYYLCYNISGNFFKLSKIKR